MWGLRGAKVFERARRVGEIEELGIAGQQERSVSGRGHGGEAVARAIGACAFSRAVSIIRAVPGNSCSLRLTIPRDRWTVIAASRELDR